MEDIKSNVDEMFDNINNTNLNSTVKKEEIDELVNNQNSRVEYRNNLISQIEKIKEYGINIEYDDNTSIEELENIINDVQF